MTTRIAAAVALVAMSCSATAQPRASACLTRAEAAAAITFVLPGALTTVKQRCAATLGAQSYLTRNGQALEARYRVEAERGGTAGRAALVKMIGTIDGVKFSDATIAEFATIGVAQAIGDLKVKDCAQVDDILALIDPLPARNVAELTVRLLDSGKPDKNAPFRFCPRT